MCAIHIMNKQLPLTVLKTWQTIALMLLSGMYLFGYAITALHII